MATKGDVSDLDTLEYGGSYLIPLASSFSGSRRSGVVQSDVEGGAYRQRKKYYNMTYLYNAEFFLETPQQQDFLKVFFERNEGKKFICHLAADRATVEPYVVQVVSDWSDSERNAITGTLSVTLEVFSTRETSLDDTLYDLYTCMGDDMPSIIRDINILAKMFL